MCCLQPRLSLTTFGANIALTFSALLRLLHECCFGPLEIPLRLGADGGRSRGESYLLSLSVTTQIGRAVSAHLRNKLNQLQDFGKFSILL